MSRRNVTSEFLRDCIAEALLRLLREKPLESISISEITHLAGVGRSTYYRNFDSKEAVLRFKMQRLWQEWRRRSQTAVGCGAQTQVREFLRFLLDERAFLELMIQNGLSDLCFQSFYTYFSAQAQDEKIPAYVCAYQVFGLMGVVYEWLEGGMKETPQELSEIVARQMGA